jgi:nitrogen regulatory protein PII
MNPNQIQSLMMNVVIVHHGLGSKVISLAKETGVSGGTVLFGKGTARSNFLRFLELTDIRKEIVLVLSSEKDGNTLLDLVAEKLRFHKKNTGVAFSIEVNKVYGSQYCEANDPELKVNTGGRMNMHESIFVIVDKGKAVDVVEAAQNAGAKGATVINGRGSGIHETSKIFAFDIEPEKEIVLILTEKEITEQVCDAIVEKTGLDAPGKGIMFVQNVKKVYGIR